MTEKKKKIGRPKSPKGEAKSVIIQFRVSETERQIIEKAAHAHGIGISEWARALMIPAALRAQ